MIKHFFMSNYKLHLLGQNPNRKPDILEDDSVEKFYIMVLPSKSRQSEK